MEEGWTERLWHAIERDERSPRALSIAAGLGVNYLNQTRARGTHPVSDKLASILEVLGAEASLYVMTGLEITTEDQAFLKLLAGYDAEQKKAARAVIEAVLARPAAPELLPVDLGTTAPKAPKAQDHLGPSASPQNNPGMLPAQPSGDQDPPKER